MAFYLLNKEKDITSNDLVSLLKKKLNIKSVGHSGTLDPFATGLIILATEGEKKLLDRFLIARKTYSGKILFGKSTDTMDVTGKTIRTLKAVNINYDYLTKVINEKFMGDVVQTPPIFSAKKINGKKAYEYARQNKEINLKSENKKIFSFSIKKETNDTFSF